MFATYAQVDTWRTTSKSGHLRALDGRNSKLSTLFAIVGVTLAGILLFGVRSSTDACGFVNAVVKDFVPVSTYKIAKDIQWGSIQKSCKPSKPGAMNVLVTGSAGFIGFHASLKLKEKGAGVLGIDNMNDYYPTILKRARVQILEQRGIFTLEADINDEYALRQVLDACKFTHVLHLAAQAGVRHAVKNPGSYVFSNLAGFVNLLEHIVHTKPVPRVVFASSSSVYGLNKKLPFSEHDRTDQPASLYAATKKANEALAHTYNHIHGLSVTSLRFFTVYGPFGRPDMAYFSFANNIVRNKPISIFKGEGDEELARDFTHVSDIVAGIVSSLETSEVSGRKPDGSKPLLRTFNLGNTHPVTVSDLVSVLEKYLGKAAKREYVSMPQSGDVMFTHANISRAATELGYVPRISLDEGLRQFAEWYLEFCAGSTCTEIQAYKPAR